MPAGIVSPRVDCFANVTPPLVVIGTGLGYGVAHPLIVAKPIMRATCLTLVACIAFFTPPVFRRVRVAATFVCRKDFAAYIAGIPMFATVIFLLITAGTA